MSFFLKLLGGSWLKIAGYAAAALAIGLLVYKVSSWHSDSLKLAGDEQRLQAEHICTVGSECYQRSLDETVARAKAVNEAIQKEKDEEAQAAKDRDNAAAANKAASDKAINEAHAKNLSLLNQLEIEKAKNHDCGIWYSTVVACHVN